MTLTKHKKYQRDTSQRHPFCTGTMRNAHFTDVGSISRPSSNASMAQSARVPRCTGFIERMLVHLDGGVRRSMPGQVHENRGVEFIIGSTKASRGCFAFVKGIVGVGAPPPVFSYNQTPVFTTGAIFARCTTGQGIWFCVFFKIVAIVFIARNQTVCAFVTQKTKFAVVGALHFAHFTIRAIY